MDLVRVLVVDDDAAVRQSLSTALGRDGYQVLATDGGDAALAHMAAASVDAIVLDVAMAEPNGLEVCRRLRARGDRTPILMLTARDLVDDRVAGLDAGADDYLSDSSHRFIGITSPVLAGRFPSGPRSLAHGGNCPSGMPACV